MTAIKETLFILTQPHSSILNIEESQKKIKDTNTNVNFAVLWLYFVDANRAVGQVS